MNLEQRMKEIETERKEVVQDSFSFEKAYKLGTMMYEKAKKEDLSIVISITMNHHQVFYVALPGTTCDNDNWVRRKQNTVYYFEKSSYEMSLAMELKKDTIDNRYALEKKDYVAAGGCVPVVVKGVGLVGTVGISGLKQNEDHDFVIEALRQAKEM
ncbi:MAG: heme-degrading domain-containing protein [Anaerostipes sp.]|nr:heme-degrading domain-containing protein [Anaerostipes sp.]